MKENFDEEEDYSDDTDNFKESAIDMDLEDYDSFEDFEEENSGGFYLD